jgi:hypothetical protein
MAETSVPPKLPHMEARCPRRTRGKEQEMRRWLEIGGLVAGVVLIAFGVAALVMGVSGTNTVKNSIKQEQIVGTPDMTPSAIKGEAAKAGLTNVSLPTCNVAGTAISTGDQARCFAQYMRIHTLEATSGMTYSQMGRYQALATAPKAQTDGQGATSNDKYAVVDPKTKQPVENARRNIWVTSTALTTALNTSYMASRLAIFGIVVGVALLLSGIGFVILAAGGALRHPAEEGEKAKALTPAPVA